MSDRTDAGPPRDLLYVTLDDDFAAFDPGVAECYWRGAVDPAIGPAVRRDLYRCRAIWIEAAYLDADGAVVPQPRPIRRRLICPFRELDIDGVLRWFAALARPLPRVVRMDRVWWEALGPLARGELGAAEPPPPAAEPIYLPKPPPPPAPLTAKQPKHISAGTPPRAPVGGWSVPRVRPTYGPGRPVAGTVPAELRAAFPDALWVGPRVPGFGLLSRPGPPFLDEVGKPRHALPFYDTFSPSESDTPPVLRLDAAGHPDRPKEGLAPFTPTGTSEVHLASPGPGPSTLQGQATATGDASPLITPESIALALTRARKHVRARLVEYMANRSAAEFADIANEVHGDSTVGESTIRANVDRTNDELAAHAAPFRFRCAGAKVFKEFDPVASCNGDAAQS